VRAGAGREIPIATSRKPEKYSSAAPLVADARQRIVAEYVSLADGITYTVFVGPATGSLLGAPQDSWTAQAVANMVLSDRSAVRTYFMFANATILLLPGRSHRHMRSTLLVHTSNSIPAHMRMLQPFSAVC
jgi:hypothetical protein